METHRDESADVGSEDVLRCMSGQARRQHEEEREIGVHRREETQNWGGWMSFTVESDQLLSAPNMAKHGQIEDPLNQFAPHR